MSRLFVRAALFASLVTVCFRPGAAGAQVPEFPLKLRSVAGPFGTYSMVGEWTQRIVTVRNATDVARPVKVEYVTSVPNRGKTAFSRIFPVPARANRRAEIVLRPGIMTLPGGEAERNRSAAGASYTFEQKYVLWDLQTGGHADQYNDPDYQADPRTTRIVILSKVYDEHETYRYLKEGLPHDVMGDVQIVGHSGGGMPTRWYAYGMVNVAFLGGMDLSRVRGSQVEALLDWVRRGGVLVVFGSRVAPDMLQGALARAAGLTAAGVHYMSDLQVGGLVDRWTQTPVQGRRFTLNWPLPMVELLPVEAEVLLTANGLPLLTRHPYGDGQVFTLAAGIGAFQYRAEEAGQPRPAARDRGDAAEGGAGQDAATTDEGNQNTKARNQASRGVWGLVGKGLRVRPAIDSGQFLAPACDALQQIAGRPGPRRVVPVVMILAIAAAAIILGVFLRFRRRGELLWAVLVPCGLVIGGVIYGVGLLQSDQERLTHVGIISGLSDGAVSNQTVFAYYSGPGQQVVTFSSGSPGGVIVDVGQTSSSDLSSSEVRFDNALVIPDQAEKNGTRAIYAADIGRAPGIDSRLTFDGSGLTGTLANRLGSGISRAVIYVNRRTYRVGDLPAGAATPVAV
ncbi:MAG TPA: hypothetical protein VMZ50_12540, partial [Phycisphaerae bacterium]|nr:hypothetical protein [Phycisphaerae bacterium]